MAYTAIDDPEAYFQVELYTGTGSELAATLDGDTDMQPDFVWTKNRDQAEGHKIFDSVRGVTKFIMSNNTDTESTAAQTLKSFDSDGVTIGTDADMNTSNEKNVLWCWKESATAGFDIVGYTGNGSARTIAHSLSAVPKMIIIKNRDTIKAWQVGHESIGWGNGIYLNENSASQSDNGAFNSTDPTTSVFSIETSSYVNTSSDNYITYLWAEKQGFSKFGGYTGNGNADGTFIYTGFRPSLVIWKKTSASGAWPMYDIKRDPINPMTKRIQASDGDTEADQSAAKIDFLSNGIKLRTTDSEWNGSGVSYIYAAFAEQPFVNSNGVPCNAR